MSRPWIRDHTTAVLVGAGLVVAGFVVLYDAYDGSGRRKPWWAGPFLPW